ncbi:MAG: GntR family transcriptional regulator [Clostridium sp.]|nr:GntR family transcriptional regulator [Clostridium sp.]
MNIVISNSGEVPIYEQIASQIKSAMIAGEVKPGEPLPSLRFLAKELRVSVISTKRAYEELEREGYITSVPGKGSFAAEINRELLREEQYKRLEEHLNEAVDAARMAGISLGEMKELLETLYEE